MTPFLDTTAFRALGTDCSLGLACTPLELPLARAAALAARAEVQACERVLSRFDAASDLARLNAAPGRFLAVHPLLLEALEAALRFARETDGRCTPFALAALTAAGYDRSFELLAVRDPEPAPSAATEVQIDRAGARVCVSRAGTIDLGGTAKGLIASRALAAARRSWPALRGAVVDLGGDVAVLGSPPEGGAWHLGVEDPRRPGGLLGTLRIDIGGAATSGPSRRRFGPGGALHHLIDPVTRVPTTRGPLAATVVAADPAVADAHATALAITPVAEASAYVAARPGIGAVVVPADGAPLVLGAVDFTAAREAAA